MFVAEVRPDKVNTTSGLNNTTEDTRVGEAGHLGSLPLPIAVLLNVTFGRSQFFLLVQGDDLLFKGFKFKITCHM